MPPHQFEQTVAFDRDALALEPLKTHGRSEAFRFGSRCPGIELAAAPSRTELWLELQADETAAAADHLAQHGVARYDGMERLPEGFDGCPIVNPAGTVHLVVRSAEDAGR